MEEMFENIKLFLNTGGVFLLLDLYEQKTIVECLISAIAIPANIIIMKVKIGSIIKTEKDINAGNEHSKHDKYMTLNNIRKIADETLPGVILKKKFQKIVQNMCNILKMKICFA